MPVEVKRTLVKSPPELWAELSDPASLARHLGEFGEVRTVRTEPETTVEWEATDVRGTVEIKSSGWGTRVTLSLVREPPEREPAAQLEQLPAEPETAEPEPEPAEQPAFELKPEPEAAEPTPEPEPEAETPESAGEPEPRPGLFARLFRRRRRRQGPLAPVAPAEVSDAGVPNLALEPEAIGHADPEPEPNLTPEPEATAQAEPEPEPEPIADPEPAPAPDLAAELAAVEAAMAEQDAALLTAVLDRLGAAHHRPFSRG
jgi:hypothetical protein